MAETTENYGLLKPEEHEYYSVGIQNENMEKIDEALTNKGNGAVWYATEVTQGEGSGGYILYFTIPNFQFSENCVVVAKLGDLAKSQLTSGQVWSVIVNGGMLFRMVAGGNTTSHCVTKDQLYGNQLITMTLSNIIKDPVGGTLGTAFLSAFPANREFYSLEQLGFTPADFSSDNADTAIEKLIDSMPPMATLRVNLPQTNTLADIFRTRVQRDVGADWTWGSVLEIKKTADKWQPNKITLLRNMGNGSETQEVYTYYDNTLGTFKHTNTGSNKNLLHNWDFRNPVNQRSKTSYLASEMTTSSEYCLDRWRKGDGVDVRLLQGKINIKCNALTGRNFSQIIEQNLSGQTVTFSVVVENVVGNVYMFMNTAYGSAGGVQKNIKTDGLHYITLTASKYAGSTFYVQVNPTDVGSSVDLISAKLELGSISTLLNDPPADYGEQLALCQRYALSIGNPAGNCGIGFAQASTAGNINVFISTPVTMRSSAIMTVSDPTKLVLWTGTTSIPITSWGTAVLTKNGQYLIYTRPSQSVIIGEMYWLRLTDGATAYLDANL